MKSRVNRARSRLVEETSGQQHTKEAAEQRPPENAPPAKSSSR
jgi:hypothetical protein